jgi:hypothetical protein
MDIIIKDGCSTTTIELEREAILDEVLARLLVALQLAGYTYVTNVLATTTNGTTYAAKEEEET